MKQQFFNNVSLDTQKLIDKVEELMSMDINHPQERLLWQVRFKLMEASMFIKAAEDRGQPTLFDNMPPQDNSNQGRLFDDSTEIFSLEPKAEIYEVTLSNQQPIAQNKLPAIDDVRMAFKKYCQNHGKDKAKEAIKKYGVNTLSELYDKGDSFVSQFYNSIV